MERKYSYPTLEPDSKKNAKYPYKTDICPPARRSSAEQMEQVEQKK